MPNMINDHLSLLPTSAGRASATLRPRLFHYTTLQGFLGIVSSKVIWATNIHYLNDSEGVRIWAGLPEGGCRSVRRPHRQDSRPYCFG